MSVNLGEPQSLFLDWLLFRQFQELLGGRVRVIGTGGAPLRSDVFDFLRVVVTPNIFQGYGMTESSCAIAIDEVPSSMACSQGTLGICCEVKLRRVEGYDYDPRGSPPCGELWVRGPNVFSGYYRNENATQEAFSDGWFKTGDIVRMGNDGSLQILDRVDAVIKLSQGLYVSLGRLCEIYEKTPGVRNIYVYGDSHYDFLGAAVVLGSGLLDFWKDEGVTDFIDSRVVEDDILKRLNDVGVHNRLTRFEMIKVVVIDTEEFSVDNGLLSSGLKLQFAALRKKYEGLIMSKLEAFTVRGDHELLDG
jgi:long-chain acyl-CoA synthetase